MTSTGQFRPQWTSPPGDTIRGILNERGISEDDFPRVIGCSDEDARYLLQGRLTISIGLARKLERSLGASVEFWLSRDFHYREDSTRNCVVDRDWLSEIPVNDLVKFGWLRPAPRPSDEMAACLQFFGVPSVAAWKDIYGALEENTAFRTSVAFDSKPAAVAAWLRQGEIEADDIDCEPWQSSRLSENLQNIRSLTRKKDSKVFLPRLRDILASSGVALAIVRTPRGCRASGAVRFLDPDRALIQLSFRFLSDDHFWFSLFHEIGHLLLHNPKGIVLEQKDAPESKEEDEANEFAARTLIPDECRSMLMKLRSNSRDVIRFSRKVGISPGIVVGQMQHHELIKRSHLNGLKRRFTWD